MHSTLNKKIWSEDNRLLPEVEDTVRKSVNLFISNVDIPIRVVDIHIVGSNASYNYTDKSDLDAHIVVNYKNFDAPDGLVSSFMNALRAQFNSKYEITAHGVPVELYVEDINSGV